MKNGMNLYKQHANKDETESVYFYSNAILLNNDAIDKNYIVSEYTQGIGYIFSIGGVDKESYEPMYGVNKFDGVSSNIVLYAKL